MADALVLCSATVGPREPSLRRGPSRVEEHEGYAARDPQAGGSAAVWILEGLD